MPMKQLILAICALLLSVTTLRAQDNVAEIAHSFMKAIKTNDISKIQGRYLDENSAYAILPKESTGMSAKQKKATYIDPLYKRFADNFDHIQKQIKDGNINPKKIDLLSYKIEKLDPNAAEAKGKKYLPQAMSLFFNYNKKEHVLPISVVEIDEHWYIVEILYTTDLFK